MDYQESRLLIFISVALILFVLEYIKPKIQHKRIIKREIANILLMVIGAFLVKVIFDGGIHSIYDSSFFNTNLSYSLSKQHFLIDLVGTFILFDFIIYWQHRAFHHFDFLWKFHAVHHCDQHLSTTSGVRFHPFEIILSAFLKLNIILIFTPSINAFLTYEIILSSMALFNHSNLSIPAALDKSLRKIIVTPSFHRPHHATNNRMNTNYGNTLVIWDKWFNSEDKLDNYTFGLKNINKNVNSLWTLISLPFKS